MIRYSPYSTAAAHAAKHEPAASTCGRAVPPAVRAPSRAGLSARTPSAKTATTRDGGAEAHHGDLAESDPRCPRPSPATHLVRSRPSCPSLVQSCAHAPALGGVLRVDGRRAGVVDVVRVDRVAAGQHEDDAGDAATAARAISTCRGCRRARTTPAATRADQRRRPAGSAARPAPSARRCPSGPRRAGGRRPAPRMPPEQTWVVDSAKPRCDEVRITAVDGGLGGEALRGLDVGEALAHGPDDPPAADVGAERDRQAGGEDHPDRRAGAVGQRAGGDQRRG